MVSLASSKSSTPLAYSYRCEFTDSVTIASNVPWWLPSAVSYIMHTAIGLRLDILAPGGRYL